MDKQNQILVAGAGGFIGGHMVKYLREGGHTGIRAVDIKPLSEWFQIFEDCDNQVLDLRDLKECQQATDGIHTVYNFASDMGGMGYIEQHKALCMLSVLINTHLLKASVNNGVKRYFYASSACVYNIGKQRNSKINALKETDAYPAMPEDGYGWEKLFSERMCRHFAEDFDIDTRVARFHNVYGPFGTWAGGREKAPAAICRKVLEAKFSGIHEIEIWGDGHQTRSFMYIDDCLIGIDKLMRYHVPDPVNLGSDELVSIDQLVTIVEEIGGIKLKRNYNLSAPKGVNGRNSDNTLLKSYVGWAPEIPLREGIRKTFQWIEKEYMGQRETKK